MKNIFLSTVAIIALIGCGGSGAETSNIPVAKPIKNPKIEKDKSFEFDNAIKVAEKDDNNIGDTTDLYLLRGEIEIVFIDEEYKYDELIWKDKNGKVLNETYKIEGVVDTSKVGEYLVSYYILDSDGNKRGFKKHVFVVKNSSPKIELIGKSEINLKIGQIYNIPYVKVYDREDRKSIEDRVEIYGIVDIYKPGTYDIKYSVVDRGGLRAEVIRRVIVVGEDDMNISSEVDNNQTIFNMIDYLKTKEDHNVEIYNQRELISNSMRKSFAFGSYIGEDKIILSENNVDTNNGVFDLSFEGEGTGDSEHNTKIPLSASIGDKLTESCSMDGHYKTININDKSYDDVIKIVCKNRSEGYYKKDFGLIAENILLPRTGIELSLNDSDYIGRELMNVDALYGPKYNLSGKGIKIGIVDGGFVLDTHKELKNRVFLEKLDEDNINFKSHPAHVAGIIGSSGIDTKSIGVATSAVLYSYSFEQYEDSNKSYFYDMYKKGIYISNHSYGPDEGDIYDGMSQATDNFIASHPNHISIVSSGNSREGSDDYKTIRDFASAKNVITVGAVDKNKEITSFSSVGPVNGGRIKPDIVGYGEHVYSLDTENEYAYKRGTSMSAPHITGLVALLEEEYKKVNSTLMREDTAKAILVNSATDLGRVGPDYEYGYGIPDALKAVNIIDSMARYDSLVKLNDVNENNSREYSLYLAEDSDIRVTLSWIDPKFYEDKITDTTNSKLHIKIVDESGKIYYPWSLDYYNYTDDAVKDVNDVDNVQQVEAHLKQGRYRVIISNTMMNIGIKQKFSLVSSAPLGGTALTKEQMSKAEFEYFMMNIF